MDKQAKYRATVTTASYFTHQTHTHPNPHPHPCIKATCEKMVTAMKHNTYTHTLTHSHKLVPSKQTLINVVGNGMVRRTLYTYRIVRLNPVTPQRHMAWHGRAPPVISSVPTSCPPLPAAVTKANPDWGRRHNRVPRPSKYGGTWHKCGRDGWRWNLTKAFLHGENASKQILYVCTHTHTRTHTLMQGRAR